MVAAPAVRIHRRGHVIGDGAEGIGGRVDEAEEPRVGIAHRPRHHVLADEGDDLVRRPAGLRQGHVEGGCVGADLPEHRPFGEPRPMLGDAIGGQPAQPPHLLGVEVEVGHGVHPSRSLGAGTVASA